MSMSSSLLDRTVLPTHTSEVTFAQVGKSFPSAEGWQTVLQDISFSVAPGEIVAIIGASGCGKSTLLRAAAGLSTASVGTVSIDGDPVHGLDMRVAVGFQEPRLLPWRTLEKNVALGLPKGTPKAEGGRIVAQLLELVGLSAYSKYRPREISGGMAQRASLARALARAPGILLLDEPFGALDALTRIKMQDLLLDIHAQDPTTVLLVTHDVEEALILADRVIVLGKMSPELPATIKRIVEVPGARPRHRGNQVLAQLRNELLAELGVEEH